MPWALLHLLEAIRFLGLEKKTRFYQASTSELYGLVQDVKKIVERLKPENRTEVKLHRKIYRPWGAYDSIDMGERFQVKRITVKPGAQLSLQVHHHRAEHWIVVRGTAVVTNGDQEILLTEKQSTYIPIGVVHRLENPGKFDLELIEVQSGGGSG